jgi:ribosomal protein L35AE/L33A
MDRMFERQRILLAHIARQHAREGAVETRMRHAFADRPIGRNAISVRADQRAR